MPFPGLNHNVAGWTIDEELSRPARTSRINEAKFSQPLCTALQIALVDAITAVGIVPAVPTLIRRKVNPGQVRQQVGVESFLAAVDMLHPLHAANVDFSALMKSDLCLPGSPCYPWNHQRRYWFNTHISCE